MNTGSNVICFSHLSPSDDTIDESYGVAVVFNEEDEEGGRKGRSKESNVAHDDDDLPEDIDEEGVEADYDEVLKTDVSYIHYKNYFLAQTLTRENWLTLFLCYILY